MNPKPQTEAVAAPRPNGHVSRDRNGERPPRHGDRPAFAGERPQQGGERSEFSNERPGFSGERPPRNGNRSQGQRPPRQFDNRGPRPEGQRPPETLRHVLRASMTHAHPVITSLVSHVVTTMTSNPVPMRT